MIRVLHVIDHLGLGGAQTALLDMLSYSDRATYAPEVAVMNGRGPFADALAKLGIPVHVLSPSKWPPRYIPNFLALIREQPYDILHFHLQGANWLAKPLAALSGHPIRISHDHTSGDLKFRGIPSLAPDSLSHLFSNRVIAVSDGVRDFLTRWEAVPDDVVVTIPNGVNLREFQNSSSEEKKAARAQWKIPAGAFVAGGMGRLAYEKNFVLIPDLAQRHPEVFFVIAGSGPEKHAILARAAQLGVADRVLLLGAVSDRPAFYRTLDAFLLPSLYEGLPMAVLEAMASGIPVLASRLEGVSAALHEEEEGLFAIPGDSDSFSAQLSRLTASPELRQRLAVAAREKVALRYSAALTAARVEDVYQQELTLANVHPAARTSAR